MEVGCGVESYVDHRRTYTVLLYWRSGLHVVRAWSVRARSQFAVRSQFGGDFKEYGRDFQGLPLLVSWILPELSNLMWISW